MEPYHLQHQQEVINDKHVNSYDDFNYMTIADVLSLFQAKIFVSQEGSWEHQTTVVNESDSGLKFSIWKKEERNENQSENGTSVKWMSSKMRLMKKMMHSGAADDIPNNSMQKFELHPDNNNNTTIRVCADCNTTKTPLWRSGPRGPKVRN